MALPITQSTRDVQKTEPSGQDELEDDDGEGEEKINIKSYLIGLGRDILIAIIVMSIIIGSLWAYTGNWPPMVVIESNSMMHGSDSSIGTIDTGDLVLVKKISGRGDITTYVEGRKSGYKTYGSYGDVIIFKKNGLDDTPVIHRALVWIEYNASGYHSKPFGAGTTIGKGSYDVPELNQYNKSTISIPDFVPRHINITIDLTIILDNFLKNNEVPQGGILTKGDNNAIVDQVNLRDSKNRLVMPIRTSWIVGKAEGELPWFGLIKLYVSGETNEPEKRPPPTSVNMLILSIALIIIIPIVLDLSFSYINKKLKKRKEDLKEKEGNDRESGPMIPPVQRFAMTRPPPKGPIRPPFQKPGASSSTRIRDDQSRWPPKKDRTEPETKQQESQFTSKEELFKKIK